MKKLILLAMLSMVLAVSNASGIVPVKLLNNSEYADGDIYVAIIGRYRFPEGEFGCYYDLRNNSRENTQVKRLTPGVNTLTKAGETRTFGNVFTKLSDIKDHIIYMDETFACRMFFSFNSPMYMEVHSNEGAYAGADFGNPTDPNHGVRWELVEFSNTDIGLWINTSRVDAFQYPMGLQLYGKNTSDVKYIKAGEIVRYQDVIGRWQQQHGGDIYSNCLLNDITTDNKGGIILQPSKVPAVKASGFFDGYINQVWDYFRGHTMRVKLGVLGEFEGKVEGNEFKLYCKQSNYGFNADDVAIIGKPTTTDAVEGAGAFATGDPRVSMPVQAMFCGAFNRGVVRLTEDWQDWSPEGSNYFSGEYTCNEYVKFFHQDDITYQSRTYAFAYDDTYDQSSTCYTHDPESVTVTIGGFVNNGGDPDPVIDPNPTPNPDSGNDGYKLVWSDEFDSNTLGKNWNVEVTSSPNNNELQAYTNREKNVKIENGNLVITASRENYDGRSFTSGRVNSQGLVYFTHGKIEASIKMPNLANGLWPAFWMMGNDIHSSGKGWPYCGEIDIMEAGHTTGIQAGKQNQWAGATLHWGDDWQSHQYWPLDGQHDLGKVFAGDGKYHKWTCEWDETWLKMYLDDSPQPYETFAISKSIDSGITSDAYTHKPFFILFNMAVGGDFPQIFDANGVTALGPDASMYIDYVRVYQKDVNIVFGENDGSAQADAPVITPYMMDDSGWAERTSITIKEGSTFALGPQANGNAWTEGTWSWTGPNGFTSNDREVTFNNVGAAQAGDYTVTFTDKNGGRASSTMTVNITGINGIREVKATERKATIYNLQGEQVSRPTQRGVYIVGGKKVVISK